MIIVVLLNAVLIVVRTEVICSILKMSDKVAEWLRRWTANPFPSGSVGSNPILVVCFYVLNILSTICAYKDKKWI